MADATTLGNQPYRSQRPVFPCPRNQDAPTESDQFVELETVESRCARCDAIQALPFPDATITSLFYQGTRAVPGNKAMVISA